MNHRILLAITTTSLIALPALAQDIVFGSPDITIDLGAEQDVAGVEFLTRRMLDGTATTEMFTITVDGEQTFGPYPAGSPATPNFAALDFTGQEIRFDVNSSTGGNVGAIEVRVFAPAP